MNVFEISLQFQTRPRKQCFNPRTGSRIHAVQWHSQPLRALCINDEQGHFQKVRRRCVRLSPNGNGQRVHYSSHSNACHLAARSRAEWSIRQSVATFGPAPEPILQIYHLILRVSKIGAVCAFFQCVKSRLNSRVAESRLSNYARREQVSQFRFPIFTVIVLVRTWLRLLHYVYSL